MGNGKSHEAHGAAAGASVADVEGDVDDVAYLLKSRPTAASYRSESSFEVDASVVFRGDHSEISSTSSSLRRRLSRSMNRRRAQQPAQWTAREVIDALDADELTVSIPAGLGKFAVLEAVNAVPGGVRTFITQGFGHHVELTIRIIDKAGDEATILGLRRLANALAHLADTTAEAVAPYKLVHCDLFPWEADVILGQGREHGLVLIPDALLEPLNNRRRKFLSLLALQPEEWQLAKQIPTIPLHAFISSDTGCANPLMVNSSHRPSMLDLGAIDELRAYAPVLHPVLAAQSTDDIDLHTIETSTGFEIVLARSQVTGVFSVLEDQLLGDVFGLKTLRLKPRDTENERPLVFRNRRGAAKVDTSHSDKIIIDSGDNFYGSLIAAVWSVRNDPLKEAYRGLALDDEQEDDESKSERLDLSTEFGGAISFHVRIEPR